MVQNGKMVEGVHHVEDHHGREAMDQRQKTEDQEEPLLPLDERFRQAEQFQLDLDEPKQPSPKPFVCIGYCAACPRCR